MLIGQRLQPVDPQSGDGIVRFDDAFHEKGIVIGQQVPVLPENPWEEGRIEQAGHIFQRDKLHRLAVLGGSAFFRDQPAEHGHALPDPVGHVRGRGDRSNIWGRGVEGERMAGKGEAERVDFMPDDLLTGIITGNGQPERGGKQGARLTVMACENGMSGMEPPEQPRPGHISGHAVKTAGSNQQAGLCRWRSEPIEKILKRPEPPRVVAVVEQAVDKRLLQAFDHHEAQPQGRACALRGPSALVHVGRQDGQSHPPGFRQIGKGRIKPALIADDRRHEFGGIVGAEIGRLEGDLGVAGRMGFAKTITGKTHDHVPDRLNRPGIHRPGSGAVDELAAVIPQAALFVFFAEHFAKLVAVFNGKPGQMHGHLRHVLLVHHDAMGLAQHLFDRRMQRAVEAAVRPPDEFVNEPVGGGTDQRRDDDKIVKDVGAGLESGRHAAPQFSEQQARGRRFDVKTADGLTPLNKRTGLGVLKRIPGGIVESAARMGGDGG